MNRDVKFRAKEINTNNWVYGYYAMRSEESTVQHFILIDKGINGFEEVLIDVNTLCQFTGLQDKDKKQIYEGDIAKYENTIQNYDDDDVMNPRHFKTPQYETKTFLTTIKYKRNSFVINDDTKWTELTVIGNIFDNQKLLTDAVS